MSTPDGTSCNNVVVVYSVCVCVFRFGTFLCNCDKDRTSKNVFSKTVPLWVHIAAIKHTLLNPQYHLTNEV